MESFNDYKKTLDQNFSTIDYLYSGDIISSDKKYSNRIFNDNKSISPKFIISTIEEIYKKSFETIVSKVEEEIILVKPTSGLPSIIDNIVSDRFKSNKKWIFSSNAMVINTGTFFGISSALPRYFFKNSNLGANSDLLSSPLIDKGDNEDTIFVVNNPIQSLCYIIQNMEYRIENGYHEIDYTIYNCDFRSIKIIIKDITEIRNDKINDIIS